MFGIFDPWVLAVTVQRSLDGIAFLLEARPDLNLAHYGDELVALFDRATRNEYLYSGAGRAPGRPWEA